MIEGQTRTIKKFAIIPVMLDNRKIIWLTHYNAMQECKMVTTWVDYDYFEPGRCYQVLDWVIIGKTI